MIYDLKRLHIPFYSILKGLLLVSFSLTANTKANSIYFFNLKKTGTINDRSSLAIQNEIKNTLLKQGDLDLVKDIDLTTFLEGEKIDLKDCDLPCYKKLGIKNNLNFIVKGEMIKRGSKWQVDFVLIDVLSKQEPYSFSIKSKKGSIKLLSKIKNKINDFFNQNNVFEPRINNITSGCLDGEIKIWDKCYSVNSTDSINIQGFMRESQLTGQIPIELGKLKNLKYLNLHDNRLEGEIPKSFSKLTKLEELDLSYNLLDFPFYDILNGLPNLKKLDLEGNKWHLTTLPIFITKDIAAGKEVIRDKRIITANIGGSTIIDTLNASFAGSSFWSEYNKKVSQTEISIMDGIFTEWFDMKNKKTELVITNGILSSINHWDQDGNQLIEDGDGVFKRHYDDFLFMEGNVKNNLMVGDWKVYYTSQQLCAVVEFSGYNGKIGHNDWESFMYYLTKGKIKELYHEDGAKYFESTQNGFRYLSEYGSVIGSKYIDENGNIIFKTDGQIGPHIFKYDGKQSMFLPSREEWGSRGMKCTSVFTFQGSEEDLDISSNWKLTNCFCDDKECQSFSEVRNGSDTWWFDEPYWGCKCD